MKEKQKKVLALQRVLNREIHFCVIFVKVGMYTSFFTKETKNCDIRREFHSIESADSSASFCVLPFYSSSTDTMPLRSPTSVSSFSTPQLRGRRSVKIAQALCSPFSAERVIWMFSTLILQLR